MRTQLAARLETAKRDEAQQRVNDARRQVEEIGAARTAWWVRHRETLVAVLREGEQLDTAYGQAYLMFNVTRGNVERLYPDADLSYPANAGEGSQGWKKDVSEMTEPLPIPWPVDPEAAAHDAAVESDRAERARRSAEEYQRRCGPGVINLPGYAQARR